MADEKVVEKAEPKETPKAEPLKDFDGLIAELEKAGVTNAENLQNKLKASKEAGQLANILGTVRAENQELKDLIRSMKAPKADDDFSGGQPVDIEDVVARSVEKVLTKKEKLAQENQARFLETWNMIQQDEDFALVEPIWQEKLKDPQFVFQIQSGQVDPVKAYNKTVREFLKGMVKRSADTLKTLKPGTIKAPHMESEGAVERSKEPTPEKDEKLKSLKEKVAKGYMPSDDELIKLMF